MISSAAALKSSGSSIPIRSRRWWQILSTDSYSWKITMSTFAVLYARHTKAKEDRKWEENRLTRCSILNFQLATVAPQALLHLFQQRKEETYLLYSGVT